METLLLSTITFLPLKAKGRAVGNSTCGEAGVLPWVLVAAGLLLLPPPGACRASCAGQCFTRQPFVPPSLQTSHGEHGAGAGKRQEGGPVSAAPVLHGASKAQRGKHAERGENMPWKKRKITLHKWCY